MERWHVGTDEVGFTPNEDACFILDENNKSITDEVGNFTRPIAAQIVRDHNRTEAFEAMREALRFKRNICINNGDGSTIRGTGLAGDWVVIPLVDFEKAQAAFALCDKEPSP